MPAQVLFVGYYHLHVINVWEKWKVPFIVVILWLMPHRFYIALFRVSFKVFPDRFQNLPFLYPFMIFNMCLTNMSGDKVNI